MKIAIVGAGSVGCYYGGLLARSGARVTLIGRPAHVEAVRSRGLLLEIGDTRTLVPMGATTLPSGVGDAACVLVCVKSGDTEAIGREIGPHLEPDAAVLSFQNGVDNPERLAAIIGRPVVPVAVYVATEMMGPGHVKHNGRGDLIMGPCPMSPRIVAAFEAAGIPVHVSQNAHGALWGKLIVNCAYNALSALTRLPYGRMIGVPGIAEVMRDVVGECVAVAHASDVVLPADILADTLALATAMPDQLSSTAQDIARGRLSEIEHLNGFILRKGEVLGIPTPVNRVLLTLIQAAERRDGASHPAVTSDRGPN